MTRSQYASTIKPPAPTLTLIGGNITSGNDGTYSIWLYNRTRAGVTLFSDRSDLAIAVSQGIQITLPLTILTSGSDIIEVGIVANKDDTNPATGCVLASYPASEVFPAIINLFEDEHFVFFGIVNDPGSLPTGSDRINGMRRSVDSLGVIQAYDVLEDEWQNVYPQDFNPFLTDTLVENGADADISNINDTNLIIKPAYEGDGNPSEAVSFWIVNDTNVPIPQGTRIRLAATNNNNDLVADDYAGLLEIRFNGYVDTSTAILDTSGMTTGDFLPYDGIQVNSLILEKDLPVGSAYSLSVRANFLNFALNNTVLQGALLKLYPYFAPFRAVYNSAGRFIGNHILAIEERRRVVPNGPGLNLRALIGTGTVNKFDFDSAPLQDVPGLIIDATAQNVVITSNGTVYAAPTIPDTGDLRAIVSTEDAVGIPISLGTFSPSASELLEINLTNPAAIRADYPDSVAGTAAVLNANQVRIFADFSGAVVYWDIPISGDPNEVITVGDTSSTSTGGLPTPDADVGLFSPAAIAATISGSSNFTGASGDFYLSYRYVTTVTKISHKVSDGCINESLIPYADLSELVTDVITYWGKRVATNTLLKALTASEVSDYRNFISGTTESIYYYDPNATKVDEILQLDMDTIPGAMIRRDLPAFLSDNLTYFVDSTGSPDNSGIVALEPITWTELFARLLKLEVNGKILTIKTNDALTQTDTLNFPRIKDSSHTGTLRLEAFAASNYITFAQKLTFRNLDVKLEIEKLEAEKGVSFYFCRDVTLIDYIGGVAGTNDPENKFYNYESKVTFLGASQYRGGGDSYLACDRNSETYCDDAGATFTAPTNPLIADGLVNVREGATLYLGANTITTPAGMNGLKYIVDRGFIQTDNSDLNAVIATGAGTNGQLISKLLTSTDIVQGRVQASASLLNVTAGAIANVDLEIAREFVILEVQTDFAARVRVYETAAARTADAARDEVTAPAGQHGVVADITTEGTPGNFSWKLYPKAVGINDEASPSATIPIAVTNKDGSEQTIVLTIIALRLGNF